MSPYHCITHTHTAEVDVCVCVSVILPHDRCDATSAAVRLVQQQGVCVIQQHSELGAAAAAVGAAAVKRSL